MNGERPEASVTGIENVTGTGAGDVIQGNAEANVLNGMAGDDLLAGGGGQDTINGGTGDDSIQSAGDRVTDLVNGGSGTDTISYQPTSTFNPQVGPGVRVTLADGGAEGSAIMIYSNGTGLTSVTEDRLISIENVTGTDASDTITGNGVANELIGARGQDTLSGMGGTDILDGGAGRDTLTGGANNDTFRFSHSGIGADADHITDFASGHDKIDFSPFFSHAFEFHNGSNNNRPPPEFIGSQAFSGDGNELRIFTNSAGQTVVQLDIDQRFDTDEESIFGTNDIEIIVTGAVGQNDFLF
jgi:Ca2+-binding RTX toxin-like protein